MWRTNKFSIQQLYILPTLYVFCIYLRTNGDFCHLQHKMIGFYNRVEKCLQRGTNWVCKLSSLRFVFKRFTIHLIMYLLEYYFNNHFTQQFSTHLTSSRTAKFKSPTTNAFRWLLKTFHRVRMARAWSWPFNPVSYWGQEWVELTSTVMPSVTVVITFQRHCLVSWPSWTVWHSMAHNLWKWKSVVK
jgi:hypothetical protein